MNTRLFALFGVTLLVGVALGPAMAAAQSADAGNEPIGEDASFGQQVSAFVQGLQETSNGTGIGEAVSSFVVTNNPGNAPAHAGGPGGANASANETERGPPSFVKAIFGTGDANETVDSVGNASVDDRRGPPEHAGGPDRSTETASDGNETDVGANQSAGNGAGNGQGPPDHAGGDDDDSDDDDDDSDRGNGQGPPDDAGPPER